MVHYVRFFFEAGVDTPLWPEDMDSPYGSPCELERLPISQATREDLARLSQWYQSSIDWEYPPNPSPWSDEDWLTFRQQAQVALAALRRELGSRWTVRDESLLRRGAVSPPERVERPYPTAGGLPTHPRAVDRRGLSVRRALG
nr:hypothetical protein [Streptomyces sabulosicollis]